MPKSLAPVQPDPGPCSHVVAVTLLLALFYPLNLAQASLGWAWWVGVPIPPLRPSHAPQGGALTAPASSEPSAGS